MDVNTGAHNAQKRKLSKEKDMNESINNRIGDLPDSILGRILSFLPTKEAVRTSVLSKRWLYIWCLSPKLNFGYWHPDCRKLLMNFVERALVLRSSDIQKFSLLFEVCSDTSRVNTWISSVIRHRVQELHLYLDSITETFLLPHCLFSCESLRILELWMSHFMKLPSFICFSNLKILTLQFVLFPDQHSTQQLFSGCPVLEEIKLVDCDWANVGGICISAPMLKTLSIYDESDDPLTYRKTSGCQIIIFGTSLRSLIYVGDLLYDYCFYNSSLLADVRIGVYKRDRDVSYRAHGLLRAISNARKLNLTVDIIEVLASAEELRAHLPVFHNLTHLEFDSKPMNFSRGALYSILRNSPCLSSLEFNMGIFLSKMDCENDDWTLDPVPSCFLTHLNSIKIRNFMGTEEELCVVKNLLKNAAVLEQLNISCGESITSMKQQNTREEILMLPKRSICCEIIFS